MRSIGSRVLMDVKLGKGGGRVLISGVSNKYCGHAYNICCGATYNNFVVEL